MTTKWFGNEMQARIRGAAMTGVISGIGIVETRAVELITQGPKTGHIYRKRGVEHQASAPGEAPANQTGALLNSRRIELDTEKLSARLIFSTKYALPLEVGTIKMEPRPYARRSLAERRDQVAAAISSEIAAVLR